MPERCQGGGVTQEVHFVKKISLSLIVGLVVLLVGCAQPGKYQAPVEDRASPAASRHAMEVLSGLVRDADEWETQQNAALFDTGRIARAAVRKQKMADYAKCRIIPAALGQSVFFPRFGQLMTDQYPGRCMAAVAHYRAEQATKAKKAKQNKK